MRARGPRPDRCSAISWRHHGHRMAHALAALLLLLVVGATWSSRASGHASLDRRLEGLTALIVGAEHPAALLVERAIARREYGDLDSAFLDLERAAVLDPKLPALSLERALTHLAAGEPARAAAFLDHHLAVHPGDPRAWVALARCARAQANPREAAVALGRALAVASTPSPDLYLERAALQLQSGAWAVAEVVRGLDEGAGRLGQPPALALRAAEIEADHGAFDAALARLSAIERRSAALGRWGARRAAILERAGRPSEALATYRSALGSLQALPASRRMRPMLRALAAQIAAAIERLEGPAGVLIR